MRQPTVSLAAIEQAVDEIRRAAPALRQAGRLGTWPERISFLLDSYQFGVHEGDGNAAFLYEPASRRVSFDLRALEGVHEAVRRFGAELAELEIDQRRLLASATNLYVIHELTHITQNFPHYHLVPKVKAGLGPEGLALLDVVADFNAAWAAAHVEWMLAGCPSRTSVSDYFTLMLLLAYVIGARGFPPNQRPHKVQRFLGVMLGAVMNTASSLGILARDRIHPEWHPTVPLYMFDLNCAPELNAFMTEPKLGLLISGDFGMFSSNSEELWKSVEDAPTMAVHALMSKELVRIGVVRDRAQSKEDAARA